ncbi:MAG TPA: oligosaccharide flippase family protein [Acetobacteraceae bacterium]|jgi:lipopolysaccharide exporter|nr:oligosaccharide flippase family protein [Acetobacteraceae bacterium]
MSEPREADNLLQKTAGGAGWTIGWRATTRFLGFFSTLVLARLLVPADFGIVALGMSFSRAIDVFADLGVQDALIRQTSPARVTYDTAFTINIIRGVFTAAVIGAAAYPFAVFFGDPRLRNVVWALAAAVALDAMENVGVADFRRHFAFRREFQLSIIPRLAQVATTITLALLWRNYWALVAGILTQRVLATAASYMMHPYRPRLSLRGWSDIVGFSFWTWLIGMSRMIKGRGITMIVGATLNTTLLGVYMVGAEIAALPELELIAPLCRVCFSSFSAVRRANMDVAETFLRITSSTLVIALPASIGISAIAAPVVALAFGPNWLIATPVVQILAAACIFSVPGRVSWTLFSAFAYLRSLFWFGVVISIAQFLLLVPFIWYWGLVGAAVATALGMLAEQVTYAVVAFRRFAIRPNALLNRTWRCLLATCAMATCLVAAGYGWEPGNTGTAYTISHVLLAIGLGACVYAAVLLGLWLAGGRPDGPETDVLELLRRAVARISGTVGRHAALLWSGPSR